MQRFGNSVMIWVTLVMMFNMGVLLTAEMTAIGQLFSQVLGVASAPMVVIIALVSVVYTAGGGLFVSIVTDQLQAGLSLLLVALVMVYLAANFRDVLPTPLPPSLGPTYGGGIHTMSIYLTTVPQVDVSQ